MEISFSRRCSCFCSLIRLADRTGHGIERVAQRAELVLAFDTDAIAEIAFLDELRRAIQLGNRSRDGPRENDADDQCRELQKKEADGNQDERGHLGETELADQPENAVIQL